MCKTILILLLLGTGCLLPAQQRSPATQQGKLMFTVPPGWRDEERSSSMRVAQYRLRRAQEDNEDASVVLYYFGQGQGGSATANIERWKSQMQQPDSAKQAAMQNLEANGLKITLVDVTGTYVAETTPGSGQFLNKPGFRLLGAVVETPAGSYFVKLVGPEKTVAQWSESFTSYIKSFKFE